MKVLLVAPISVVVMLIVGTSVCNAIIQNAPVTEDYSSSYGHNNNNNKNEMHSLKRITGGRNNVRNKPSYNSISSLMINDEARRLPSKSSATITTTTTTTQDHNNIGTIRNTMESTNVRKLPVTSGKGKGQNNSNNNNNNGIVNNDDLNICWNRQSRKSVINHQRYSRSLGSTTGNENMSSSKGESGSMGGRGKGGSNSMGGRGKGGSMGGRGKGGSISTKSKEQRCASNEQGKGGSSKSKTSKGYTSNNCTDYEFTTKKRHLQKENSTSTEFKHKKYTNEIKANILQVARGIPTLSIFVDLVERTNVASILDCSGPFTTLLPSNRAFRMLDPELFADLLLVDENSLLNDILLSHIIPGKIYSNEFYRGSIDTLNGNTIIQVTINPLLFNQNATVVSGDIETGNGVIHIIDTVLLSNASPNVCDSGQYNFDGPSCGRDCKQNLIDIACEQPELSTFLSLIELSGLEEIFDCRGPFTIFAPSNDAFDNITSSELMELLRPENIDDLQDLLLYHVAPGSFLVQELQVHADGIPTLLVGQNITIFSRYPLVLNCAQVITSDILTCNGVLHIIDKVLDDDSPPVMEPSQSPLRAPAVPTVSPTAFVTTFEPSVVVTQPSPVIDSIMPSFWMSPSESPSDPTSIPTQSTTFSPTSGIVQVGLMRRFFIAFVSLSLVEPTVAEYDQMTAAIRDYYNGFIRMDLMTTNPSLDFVGLQFQLNNTRHNAGIPENRFNIYMDFTPPIAIFASNTTVDLFTSSDLRGYLFDGITPEFILDPVRMQTGTPFEEVIEAFLQTISK